MSTPMLPPTGAVLREQVRSVGLSLRREGMLLAGLLACTTVATYWAWLDGPGRPVPLSPIWLLPAVALGFFMPFLVWKDHAWQPYFHAMPVSHARHRLIRGAGGLVHLGVAVAALLASHLALVIATGGLGRAALAQPWMWMIPLTGSLITYLLGTALVLATRMPWAVMAGALLGWVLLSELPPAEPLAEAIWTILVGRLGLFAAIVGVDATDGASSLGAWLAATALWLPFSAAVLLLASHLKRES